MSMSLTAAEPRTSTHAFSLRRAAWALAAIGLALRLAFALLPLRIHLIVLEDDAWMVTAIARNFALGRGITADGINPTTGFQPLYPLTLGALPYLAAPNALDAGFTANLLICALLNTLALWPLWSLTKRFGGELAGLLAVALFALNPFLIRVSVNAMETSLGLLLLLTLFAAFYQLDLTRIRNVLALALLTALAVLARLDAALAFAAITLTLLRTKNQEPRTGARTELTTDNRPPTTDHRPPEGEERGLKIEDSNGVESESRSSILYPLSSVLNRRFSVLGSRFWVAGLYVATTLTLLAPYFAFNYAVSGSLGPSSGAALAFMHSYRGDFNLTNGVSALFRNSAIYLEWIPRPWIKLLLVLVACAGLARLLGRRLLAALPLLLYLPVPPLYYGYLLQQARERYFVGVAAMLIILIAWFAAELWRRQPGRATALALALGLALVVAFNTAEAASFYQRQLADTAQTQPTTYQAALWIRDNLPPGVLIGAKNSGLYQYYSGHTVLNIDGKLNHEIVPVMRDRRLLDYLRSRGIIYLADREETMADHIAFYSEQFGPAPHHHTPSLIERVEIYGKMAASVLGAGSPPNLDERAPWQPVRPFSDAADIVKRFPRPNQTTNPVVIYRLKPAGAPGVP